METSRQRYNAAIQRAKGLLELAASLYEGSLSFQSARPAEGVVQTDSRLGHKVKLEIIATRPEGKDSIALSFGAHGFREIRAVAAGRLSLAWLNASVALTLAFRGKGPFPRRLPLRTIAVFPSYDVMGFAVHKSTGITSLSQIKKQRIPLRLSTGRMTRQALRENTTMFTVTAVMRAAGFRSQMFADGEEKYIRFPGLAIPDDRRSSETGKSTRYSTRESRAGRKTRWLTDSVFCR